MPKRNLQEVHEKYVLCKNYAWISKIFPTKINLSLSFSKLNLFEGQRGDEKDRASIHVLTPYILSRPRAGARNSKRVSQEGDRDPVSWAVPCGCPGWAFVGSRVRRWSWGWDAS